MRSIFIIEGRVVGVTGETGQVICGHHHTGPIDEVYGPLHRGVVQQHAGVGQGTGQEVEGLLIVDFKALNLLAAPLVFTGTVKVQLVLVVSQPDRFPQAAVATLFGIPKGLFFGKTRHLLLGLHEGINFLAEQGQGQPGVPG